MKTPSCEGMKGVSAGTNKKANQMLNQVQHDMRFGSSLFVIPNLFRDLRFWV